MNFLLSAEHRQLESTIRQFAADKLRDRSKGPNWGEFASLGVLMGPVSEQRGGLGLGLLSGVIVVKELAKTLARLPALETLAFGVIPLAYAGAKELLSKLMSGEEIATGYLARDYVPSAEIATLLVSEAEGGISCLRFTLGGEKIEGLELVRTIYSVSNIRLDSVIESYDLDDADQIYRSIYLDRLILLSAEMLGAARGAEQMTLDYVKTRKQFGVPVGSFQAIQHKLADARVGLDSSEALLHFAAWARDNDGAQYMKSAFGAYVQCAKETKRAIEMFLQVHGGIGFTWEYDLHLYLRRVLSIQGWTTSPGEVAAGLGELGIA
jgi:alkylation response protein AidB-like acyl-CoA dehydrogenase